MIEGVLSVKSQVLSWRTLRRVLGVFPLQPLHFKLPPDRRQDCLYKRTQCRGAARPMKYPVFHYCIIPPFQSDVDCAKQTQLLDCGLWIGDWPRTRGGTPTLRPAISGLHGPVVQNEANSAPAGRLCETKPIALESVGRGRPTHEEPRQSCKTNPIPGGRDTP